MISSGFWGIATVIMSSDGASASWMLILHPAPANLNFFSAMSSLYIGRPLPIDKSRQQQQEQHRQAEQALQDQLRHAQCCQACLSVSAAGCNVCYGVMIIYSVPDMSQTSISVWQAALRDSTS